MKELFTLIALIALGIGAPLAAAKSASWAFSLLAGGGLVISILGTLAIFVGAIARKELADETARMSRPKAERSD